uniref:Lysine 2,3-aminomutase n=1 Tax=Moniliophthora roreri TaxID=221103 RepID=A0A0W0G5T7_MONRR
MLTSILRKSNAWCFRRASCLSLKANRGLASYVAEQVTFPDHPPLPLALPSVGKKKIQLLTRSNIPEIFATRAPHLPATDYLAAASVFPMRANNYVVEELIDWSRVPDDPIFKLVFPQPDMLEPDQLHAVRSAIERGASKSELRDLAESIRGLLNPHPANQKQENVPHINGEPVEGMQHKYRETCLFFPTEGQYCHSYCTYCFRWAQFTAVGSDQQFQSKDVTQLVDYLKANRDVTDILFTGGDPMVMHTQQFARYVDALLSSPGTENLATIRIGSKSLSYWPYRYLTDPDAGEMLKLFEKIVKSGRHLSIMAHFSHPVELQGVAVQEAMRRIRATGANIRCQAPLIRQVNDQPHIWADMWRTQTRLGAIPYYMFVERDTGAKHYFEVPLARAFDIYREAISSVAGTARTVQGPSMSASPGKIQVVGITTINTPSGPEKVFILRFLQARNPAWMKETFFAKFDEKASWLNDLKPAFGEKEFFYEKEYRELVKREGASGQLFPASDSMKYRNRIRPF